MAGIFRSIESRLERQQLSLYHIIQKYLILDDIDGLVKVAHGWLSEEDLSPHVLRCLTHLLLVLKRFGRVSYEMEDQINDIFHACVKVGLCVGYFFMRVINNL